MCKERRIIEGFFSPPPPLLLLRLRYFLLVGKTFLFVQSDTNRHAGMCTPTPETTLKKNTGDNEKFNRIKKMIIKTTARGKSNS